jgi:hypothetical protein
VNYMKFLKTLAILLLQMVLWVCWHPCSAGDSLRLRLILIGDAGEMGPEQQRLMPHAAKQVVPGKTTVFFLGDNIYPRGMGIDEGADEERGQSILRSQFEPLRLAGAKVYFIPGNHDWDRQGLLGLQKIRRQHEFLNSLEDTALLMLPARGCPGPAVIAPDDSLVVIVLDSQWWLHAYSRQDDSINCSCQNEPEVLAALAGILDSCRQQQVLLATHHPFYSYGSHGGYFSWKDHLFPLTAIKPELLIPLPVIGSLYPLYRRGLSHRQDLHHKVYRSMIRQVDSVFSRHPRGMYLSGHEHGLQLIQYPGAKLQLVSGGGAKENFTMKGRHSLYGVSGQGYATADVRADGSMVLQFYEYHSGQMQASFRYQVSFTDVGNSN